MYLPIEKLYTTEILATLIKSSIFGKSINDQRPVKFDPRLLIGFFNANFCGGRPQFCSSAFASKQFNVLTL